MSFITFYIILIKDKLQPLILSPNLKFRFNHTIISSVRKHSCISLRTHNKRKSPKEDGLAGTSLARNNDQTLWKIYFQRVYQHKILDMELGKHDLFFVFLLCHPVDNFVVLELLNRDKSWLRLPFVIF